VHATAIGTNQNPNTNNMIIEEVFKRFKELNISTAWYYPEFKVLFQITIRGTTGKYKGKNSTQFFELENRDNELICIGSRETNLLAFSYAGQKAVSDYLPWWERMSLDTLGIHFPWQQNKETGLIHQLVQGSVRYYSIFTYGSPPKPLPGDPVVTIVNLGPVGEVVEKPMLQKQFEALSIIDEEINAYCLVWGGSHNNMTTTLEDLKLQIIDAKCMCNDCQLIRSRKSSKRYNS